MKEIVIKEITVTNKEYEALLHFRNELLRKPLGLNLFDEDLSDDMKDHMLIALQGNDILGCVMLKPVTDETIQLRQMAVVPHLQRKGLGRLLVENAEQTAKENDYEKIILHARITAKAFYEKLGYTSFGTIFTEVTMPHIAMEKFLL